MDGEETKSGPRLVPVTEHNVEAACALRVRPDQERLVEPVAHSLAEAYVHREIAWPRLILDGEVPVGFLMGFFAVHFEADDPDVFRSGLWRLNIAAEHQGRGYGRFAVRALGAEILRRGQTRMTTSWEPGADGPEGFYLGLGFRATGERSGGQTVAVLELGAARPPPRPFPKPGWRPRTTLPGSAGQERGCRPGPAPIPASGLVLTRRTG